jgi:hypothetical protein
MVAHQNIPGLISRASWGAVEPDGFGTRALPTTEWWLHHSVTVAPDLVPPYTDDDAAIRLLERIGQQRFGGGISYTCLVTPVGRAYVGHSFWRRGAHTQGHNTIGAGICFVGNYETTRPTTAQLDAAAQVLCVAHRAGLSTAHRLNGGHRDTKSTTCPGKYAYAAIAQINARAAEHWSNGLSRVVQPGQVPNTTPVSNPSSPNLTVDGLPGSDTVRAWQRALHTAVDGRVSSQTLAARRQNPGLAACDNAWEFTRAAEGSMLIRAEQHRLKARGHYRGSLDGLIGPITIAALQRDLGTPVDGVISNPSTVVKALQKALNAGKIKPPVVA